MRTGTKSLLFGYHQFILHPLIVWAAWVKLFGWTWDLRIILSFFLHDVGYFGRPNMDGPEGKDHPYIGAWIMSKLFDGPHSTTWFDFNLLHSRDMARRFDRGLSRLCYADKLSFVLYPSWLLQLLYWLSDEDKEYRMNRYEKEKAIPQDGLVPFSEWLTGARQSNLVTLEKAGLKWK